MLVEKGRRSSAQQLLVGMETLLGRGTERSTEKKEWQSTELFLNAAVAEQETLCEWLLVWVNKRWSILLQGLFKRKFLSGWSLRGAALKKRYTVLKHSFTPMYSLIGYVKVRFSPFKNTFATKQAELDLEFSLFTSIS